MSEIHQDAMVHESSYVDEGGGVWHFSHILPNCSLGEDCSLGQNVVVGPRKIVIESKSRTMSAFTRESLTAFFVAHLAFLPT